MSLRSHKGIFLLACLAYLALVAFAAGSLALRRDALQFHTRDYNYFIEQAARMTDPQMSKRLTLNIEGFNFLGLQGIELAYSLYHAIHTEYFRYTYGVLYGLFHSTLLIYLFYSAVFFLPLLYYAWLARLRAGQGLPSIWKAALAFILLFSLLPATFFSVTSDLRPRMLFGSAWMLVALAIFFERPWLEKLLLFGLLIGIREEGILLGVFVILLNALWLWGKPGLWKQTAIFTFLDGLAFALFLAFMRWGGYTRVDSMANPLTLLDQIRTPPVLYAVLVGVLLLGLVVLVWLRQRRPARALLLLLTYLGAVLLPGLQVLRDTLNWTRLQPSSAPPSAVYQHIITSSDASLTFSMLLLFLILLWQVRPGRARRALEGLFAALIVLFGVSSLILVPPVLAGWARQTGPARLVWQFKASHDRLQTQVLLDYSTYQAFYDYENILVYNRLPLWLVYPEDRLYPRNQGILADQIQQRVQYAVVSRDSLPDLTHLAQLAGRSLRLLEENEQYAVLQFE